MKSLLAILAAFCFALMVHFTVQAMFDLRYLGEALNRNDLFALLFGVAGGFLAAAIDEVKA